MAEEKKENHPTECCTKDGRRCGGCKFLAGILVGFLVAGTGLGIYLAGRSHHACLMAHKSCPFAMQQQQAEPSK